MLNHELKETINRLIESPYYAFLDLEFSMSGPEYRGLKFQPEIIQFGLIIADGEGNLVEKFSAYVKPTVFPILSGKTQEFLRIPESTEAYGISYQDFYDYGKLLENQGFTQYFYNEIGENYFATYISHAGGIYHTDR